MFLSTDTKIEKLKAFTVQHETEILLRFQTHTYFLVIWTDTWNGHTHQFMVEAIGRSKSDAFLQVLRPIFRFQAASHIFRLIIWLKTCRTLAGELLQSISPKSFSTSSLSVANENSPSLLSSASFTLKICSTRAPWITEVN